MARPTTYDIELCKEICKDVTNGRNIVDILKSNKDYPSESTWFRWKDENSELWELYVRAVQNKTEFLDSEIDRYMVLCEKNKITPQQANVLIQTLKWKMSKFYPKMFGDKVQTEHSGEVKIEQITGIEVK